MPTSASAVKSFEVSHTEGHSIAPGSEGLGGNNKLVADSIRVELQRLRALEQELDESIAKDKGDANANATGANANAAPSSYDKPDAFPTYQRPVPSAAQVRASLLNTNRGTPAFPVGTAASGSLVSQYDVDLSKTGRIVVSDAALNKSAPATAFRGGPTKNNTNANKSVASSSSYVAPGPTDVSAKYLAHYQTKYDANIQQRQAKEAAAIRANDPFYGGVVAGGGSLEEQNDYGEGLGGGDPLSLIQPFTAASDDVESGISDVRSAILELKAKREQSDLVGRLEEKTRIGRTQGDDADEGIIRDFETSRQIHVIAHAQAHSPNRHPKAHAGLASLYASHVANLSTAGAGGDIDNPTGAPNDPNVTNQHGLYVQYNTDRMEAAASAAATAAAYELEQIPFASSRIGKEFNERKRRVYSAHIAKGHEAEVGARQAFLRDSTASVTFSPPSTDASAALVAANMSHSAVAVADPHHSMLAGGGGALVDPNTTSVATSGLPPLVSSFVVSRHIPNTLPRSAHSAVVGGAFHTILETAEAGKPIVNLDDLPEEPKILVQLTSVVPIAGRTAFTIPLTLATPLRVLQREVMLLAKLPLPCNMDRVEGEEHARSASAAWPQSATYRKAMANAHDSAVFRGKISASADVLPSINNNYSYNVTDTSILATVPTSRLGSALNRPNFITQRNRPMTRPNSSAAPTADGGITLYAAGADVPLDLDKSFLEQGFRFPPLVTVRGFRQEYYLATAGSDRRVPCVWRPHMTMTDLAKDIAKRLYPKDFRHVRASITGSADIKPNASVRYAGGDEGCVSMNDRVFLPLDKSVRFQVPDLVEGNPLLYEMGLGLGEPGTSCAVQFMRSVNGEPFLATSGHVSTDMSLHEYCAEAAAACQEQLDARKAELFASQTAAAPVGRARTTKGTAVFVLNGTRTAGLVGSDKSVPEDPNGLNTVQFDDMDEDVSPDGVYNIYRHRDIEEQTGIPTFSFNPTKDYVAESNFPYFITTDEDFTIRHASDCGVLPGVEVLVEFYDPYRKVWSGEVLPPMESIYDPPIVDAEGNVTYSSINGAAMRASRLNSANTNTTNTNNTAANGSTTAALASGSAGNASVTHNGRTMVSATTQRAVPTTALTRNVASAARQAADSSVAAVGSTAASGGQSFILGAPNASIGSLSASRMPTMESLVGGALLGNTAGLAADATVMGMSRIERVLDEDGAAQQRPLSSSATAHDNGAEAVGGASLVAVDAAVPPTYPISSKEAQHSRLLIRTRPSDTYDLLTITTGRGQRLRMFASDQTRVSTILEFVWAQTGDTPMETYLWMDHGQQLTLHYDTLAEAGLMASGTVHARRRPRYWLKEVLAAPTIDRTLSYTALADADLRLKPAQ